MFIRTIPSIYRLFICTINTRDIDKRKKSAYNRREGDFVIYKAIQTALKMHDRQLRKLDGDIYAAHPLEVGLLLAGVHASDEVVIAGILHDTVEDTALTLEEIDKIFGSKVAFLVKGCSESDKSLDWKRRKIEMIQYVKNHASNDEKLIIMVDKLSNIKSMYRYIASHKKYDIWDKFNAGYSDQKWYYEEMIKALDSLKLNPDYRGLFDELEKYFGLVFDKN